MRASRKQIFRFARDDKFVAKVALRVKRDGSPPHSKRLVGDRSSDGRDADRSPNDPVWGTGDGKQPAIAAQGDLIGGAAI